MYQILGYNMYEKRIDDCNKGIVRIYLSENSNKDVFTVIDVGYKNKNKFFKTKRIKTEDCDDLRFIHKVRKRKFINLPEEITWEWCVDNFECLKKLKSSIELYKTKVIEGALCYSSNIKDLEFDISDSGKVVDLFYPEIIIEK